MVETELLTPSTKGFKGTSKFWQTPVGHSSSPFTPEMDQSSIWDRNRTVGESIFTNVHNFLNQDPDPPFEEEEQGIDDKELEQLSEELIRVFSYDNIENSTDTQAETLIQRIIKIGGKDYTVEDHRRDILKIEAEDNTRQ